MNLQALYEIGLHDALRGRDRDSHNYRNPAKRAAWLRGWEDGRRHLQDQSDQAAMSEHDKRAIRRDIKRLRGLVSAAQPPQEPRHAD